MKRYSDLNLLHPSLAKIALLIEADMIALGHKPIFIETWRSPERAEFLKAKGTSKNGALSMHCFMDENKKGQSLAFDMGNAEGRNPKTGKIDWWSAEPKFWSDLEDCAVKRGLHRLITPGKKHIPENGSAESWDLPHCQAISVAEQNKVRKMTPKQRFEYIHKKLEG